MMTPLLQCVARFNSGSEIIGFALGGYKEIRSWWSLFVELSSLFVAPSGERLLLPMCWRGRSLSTISCVFSPIFFSKMSSVVNAKGAAFRPRAVVVCGGVVAGCTPISIQNHVHEK